MSKDPIGIIGLGELGTRLATQIISSGRTVLAYDKNQNHKIKLAKNMYKKSTSTANVEKLFLFTTLENVLKNCKIIHLAIPAGAAKNLPPMRKNQIAILHDSVMTSSFHAAKQHPDKSQFIIAHCLMNSAGRVMIAQDFGKKSRQDIAAQHFRGINLRPKLTTIVEHDRLMAKSQGLALLLKKSGVYDDLKRAADDHDLTPSGEEILHLLNHLELNWTEETITSLLKNPYIQN